MNKTTFKYFVYALISVFVLTVLILFPKWTVDDAFITFRYADNLAQFGQLTFNINEAPVEGYTGVLLPILISIAIKFGVQPSLASHFIGIFSFLTLLVIFYQCLLKFQIDAGSKIAALLLLTTASFQFTHVFSGMETMLFSSLLLGSSLQLHSILKLATVPFRQHIIHAVTLLLLSLCRPEGVVYAAISSGLIMWLSLHKHKSVRPVLVYLVFLLFPSLVYFMWRWNYYGYLLPNTFYAKSNHALSANTLLSMMTFYLHYLLLPMISVVIVWFAGFSNARKNVYQNSQGHIGRANIYTLGTLCFFVVVIIVQYMRSSLTMNFSYRFFVPFYPIALIIFAYLFAPISQIITEKSKKHLWIIYTLIFLLLLQVILHIKWLVQNEVLFAADYKTKLLEMHIPVGRYLKQRIPESEWLVVHIDAGAIPFYSQLKTIDFGNLNDEFLAHNKEISIGERVDYFFSNTPGALVFTSYSWNCVNHGPEAYEIINDSRFKNYALVKKYNNSLNAKYYEFIFLRRDLLQEDEEIYISNGNIESSVTQNSYNCNKIN